MGVLNSGLKVYSREIENIIYSHPATEAAAVVGVPDPEKEGSERVAVFVQVKAEKRTETSEEDYLIYLKDKVAHYALPKTVVFLEEMPFTDVQKVNKKLLREKYFSRK